MKNPSSWVNHLSTVTLIRNSVGDHLTSFHFSTVVIRDTACFVMASLETGHPVCIENRVFYEPTKVAILVSWTCGRPKFDQEQERNCCPKHISQCLFDANQNESISRCTSVPFQIRISRTIFSPPASTICRTFLRMNLQFISQWSRKWLNGKLAWKIGKSRQANDVEKVILCTQEAIINKLRSFSYVLAAYVKLSMVFNLI